MRVQGYNLDDVPFKAILGVYGSYIGLFMNILCVVAQFYVAVSPLHGSANANEFFLNMLALPVVVILFVGWKIYHGTSFVSASEADLVTGRRDLDLATLKREEMEERATWPWWKK